MGLSHFCEYVALGLIKAAVSFCGMCNQLIDEESVQLETCTYVAVAKQNFCEREIDLRVIYLAVSPQVS